MRITLTACLTLAAAPVLAEQSLYDLLRMDEVVSVMAQEGLGYGEDIDEAMLGGEGGASWAATVANIYDPEAMSARSRSDFDAKLDGQDSAPIRTFFATDLGKVITELEISARVAMADDDVEDAAKTRAAEEIGSDRMTQIARMIEAGNFLDRNVEGALTSNYYFLSGLAGSGAMPNPMSDDEIVQEVWSGEPEVRADAAEWLEAYLLMAYAPLSDDDLARYIAFAESEAGQLYVDASFAAFDGMFNEISGALGAAAGRAMSGDSL